MKNKTSIIIFLSLFSLILSTFVVNIVLKLRSTNFTDFISGNMFLNSDFKNGFKYWNIDNGISLTNVKNKIFVHTEGIEKKQTRFWQDINVESGKVYSLKFELKGKQTGAFGIYRDIKTGKEEYIWCNENDMDGLSKSYTWNIKPIRSGKNTIYLSTNKEGNYFFSNISICNIDTKCHKTVLILVFGVILFSFPLLLFFYLIFFKPNLYNIAFATFIAFLAILPILRINLDIKSDIENRNLAIFKHLIINRKINTSFGNDFNEWLNDRFFGRLIYNQLFILVKAYINNRVENDQVCAGKDRWYFRKENIKLLSRYDENKSINYILTRDNIIRLSDFCEKHNTDLYILVLPCNEEVYDENLIGIKLGNKKYAIAHAIEKLKNETGVKIFYGKDTLESAKIENYACYITDHHWTKFGAFRNYQNVMNEIHKNHEDIFSLSDDDFVIENKPFSNFIGFGSVFSMLNLPKWCWTYFCPKEGSYKTFRFKGEAHLEKSGELMTNKRGIDKCVLVFGDSMTTNIIDFFWDTFKKCILYRKYGNINMKIVEDKINNYNPDIAIMIVYYDNFFRIKNWYK